MLAIVTAHGIEGPREGRTGYELEGHGDTLLIVGHVGGVASVGCVSEVLSQGYSLVAAASTVWSVVMRSRIAEVPAIPARTSAPSLSSELRLQGSLPLHRRSTRLDTFALLLHAHQDAVHTLPRRKYAACTACHQRAQAARHAHDPFTAHKRPSHAGFSSPQSRSCTSIGHPTLQNHVANNSQKEEHSG